MARGSLLLAAVSVEELEASTTCCFSLVVFLSPFQLLQPHSKGLGSSGRGQFLGLQVCSGSGTGKFGAYLVFILVFFNLFVIQSLGRELSSKDFRGRCNMELHVVQGLVSLGWCRLRGISGKGIAQGRRFPSWGLFGEEMAYSHILHRRKPSALQLSSDLF